MAGPEVVGFQLSVDMKGLTAQLASIPGITKASATAMVKELRDSYRAAEKASKGLADNVKRDMEVVKTSTGAAKAGALNLGNQLSDIAIQLESGTPIGRIMLQQGTQVADALAMMGFGFTRLLAVIAPVGLAIGALAVVYSKLVDEQARAEKGMAAAAAEATTLADALGRVKSAQNKLNDELALAEGTVTEAQLAQRDAVVGILEEYEPLISQRREALALAKDELANLNQTIAAEKERTGQDELRADIAEELYGKRDRLESQIRRETAELENLTGAQDQSINSAVQTIAATERATEATERRRKAEEELRKEQERHERILRQMQESQATETARLKGISDGHNELTAAAEASARARMSEEERIQAELMDTREHYAQVAAAMLMASDEAMRPGIIEDRISAEVEATVTAYARIREIRAKEDAAREAEAQREIERQKEIQRAAVAAVQSSLDVMTDGFEELYDNRADIVSRLEEQLDRSEEYLTDAQREELEKRIEDQRAAARKAFEVAKAFKIAQAVIATYAAANEALASAPFPLNLVNAGLVTAAGLVNVATIASQQPAFHRGGMVDEVPINALRGEAVLSRQGRAMIGDETINRANAGASSGGSGATVVYQVYDRRILDRVTMATIKAGGKLDGYLRTQRSAPYGHRS